MMKKDNSFQLNTVHKRIMMGIMILTSIVLFLLFTKHYNLRLPPFFGPLVSEFKVFKLERGFSLTNDPNVYGFDPDSYYVNGEKIIFRKIAKRGDVIIKEAFSDTLYLFSDGERYAFTFNHFDDLLLNDF